MYRQYNPNPANKNVGDCVVRAVAKITDQDWEHAYIGLVTQGLLMYDMPSSNHVWGEYLHENGFRRYVIPDTCPACYTVEDFCDDHPFGTYALATGTHVVAVIDGDYYDNWDSGNEVPVYYWRKS